MTEEVVERLLKASTEERLRIVRAGIGADALRRHLGDEAYAEYEALARRLDEGHLAPGAPKNLVFVPGVMGSQLQSRSKGGVWWIDVRTRAHIDDLALSPDGRADADNANEIIPFTTDPQYEPFLTAVLEQPGFGHELFPFDWRKLPFESAAALRDLVVRLHDENGGKPVHLVGHSMGGLMIRAALVAYGDELWSRVGRIVFLGTPHYGSPAIAGYLKNHLWGFDLLALLGFFLSRATFRSLWGVLAMLPAPRGIYPGTRRGDPEPWVVDGDDYVHPCANFDLYRAESWKLDLTAEESARLQRVLDGAAEFHRRLYEAHVTLTQDQRDRIAVIAGVGYKTLFRLAYESRLFGMWTRMEKLTQRIEGDRHREGDGRVPLVSAELENVHVHYVRGVHGGLPNIRAVSEGVFRFLREQDMRLPTTPREALSEHLAPDGVSEAPHLDGSAGADARSHDPGFLNLEPPDPAAVEDLRAALEREELPAFTRVRIL